jgi:GNAT superfamily N-acetyltransferase
MSLRIVPFERTHARQAARLFVESFHALRRRMPHVPGDLASVDAVVRRLARMEGVVAVEGGRVVGYLASWFPIADFRGTDRVAAYAPEWAHAAEPARQRQIYRALYREASRRWFEGGCDVHAITLLAGDDAIVETWFWSGFGMGTVDAVRSTAPIEPPPATRAAIRMATPDDAPALARLDVEHNRHYTRPPVLMAARVADDESAWRAFLARPGNGAWLAEEAGTAVGFIRFDREFGGCDVVASATGIFISGAYVQPAARGGGAATAIVNAALGHYGAEGLDFCAVDFEAFNPEATSFWMRHFEPVCYSLMRVPEAARR